MGSMRLPFIYNYLLYRGVLKSNFDYIFVKQAAINFLNSQFRMGCTSKGNISISGSG